MMKKLLFALIFLVSISFNANASHIPGGNITYQCTGNPNEYIITLELYINCPFSFGVVNVTTANSCGLFNLPISLPQIGIAQELSSICPTEQSTCTGGTLPGIMSFTYQSVITLPDTCNSWTFIFEICCRNQSSNLQGGTGNSMYFETVMNSQTAPCDNSPYVTAQPSPFVCAGLPQTFCPGAIDPDGDSLYYQLISPYGAGGIPISNNAPYTPTAPLLNLVLDSTTGCITFNEPIIGNYVVTYLIEAYDNTGNMTGSIVYDFQFQVLACSNNSPTADPGGIVITGGSGALLNPNLIGVCEGNTTCFDVIFIDIDVSDTLAIDTLLSSIFTQLPGAILNVSGTNPLTINVCWTVPTGTNSSIATNISVNDGACPIMGIASQPIAFSILLSTVVNSDINICGPGSAQLNATGGSIFTWTTLSGDPIIVGTNFSCNPCANPVATPNINTTYLVTSNLSGGCNNTDTVSVLIVPGFTIQTTPDDSICVGDTVNFIVSTSIVGSYSYLWTPGIIMDDSTLFNPTAIFNTAGTNIFTIEVDNGAGCVITDTVTIIVDNCIVGVNKLANSFNIEVFPNPNNGSFTIQKLVDLEEKIELKLFSIDGKLLIKTLLLANDDSKKIDISNLSDGLYFLKLKIGKEVFTQKIIKD